MFWAVLLAPGALQIMQLAVGVHTRRERIEKQATKMFTVPGSGWSGVPVLVRVFCACRDAHTPLLGKKSRCLLLYKHSCPALQGCEVGQQRARVTGAPRTTLPCRASLLRPRNCQLRTLLTWGCVTQVF